MSLPVPLEPGTLIGGHYIIGNLISSGGFGAVYRGIDTSEGDRLCAIKETYDVTPAARRQALIEAGILFTVKSKHLPQVYDALEANGRFYLVMQLIEGQTLQYLLKARGRPYSEQEVLAWLLPIMQILQELHSRTPAVIHRDIKPGNIILTPGARERIDRVPASGTPRGGTSSSSPYAVLVDFGVTKLYDPNSNTQTMAKARAVSEGFSPVEQYLGKTSPLSDIYSLAATMYLLLTNRLPPQSITRSLHDELIAPRILNPALSPKIERVLLKALAVNAEERYQSMREFAQALREPDFSAFADPTIAVSTAQPTSMPIETSRQAPPPPMDPYSDFQSLQSLPAYRVSHPTAYPAPARVSVPPPGYVMVPQPMPPPGYVMVPQSALVPVQPLPSSFGQGCLWGLLQGVLAALLLLFLRTEASFYMGIALGFLFFLWAGFRTTCKGGRTLRGGWAGFWAGITGTIIFWITVIIGLVILVSQRIAADTTAAQQQGAALPPDEGNRALQAVIPAFSNPSTTQAQSSGATLIIFLVIGMLIAFGFGWLGGLLGRASHDGKVKRKPV